MSALLADVAGGVPDPAAGSLVEAAGIEMSHDGRRVLEHVDLAVRRREIVSLIGPNGSGKTTLLRIILGILPPESGKVWRKPGLRIGYMPQQLAVDATLPLTVGRFIALGVAKTRAQILAALEEAGAARVIDRELHLVSGGELQRALLARALLRDADLLVLDEPTQAVDVAGRADVYKRIARYRDRTGCGVLLVSHDLHLVMGSTDRVVCLNHHVCCTGAPETVTRHPEYLALFGPQIAPELGVYVHRHDHRHDVSGEVVGDSANGNGGDGRRAEVTKLPAPDHGHRHG